MNKTIPQIKSYNLQVLNQTIIKIKNPSIQLYQQILHVSQSLQERAYLSRVRFLKEKGNFFAQ